MPIGIALAFDPVRQRCDLAFGGRDFVLDSTYLTPTLISLGCDRRAHPDDVVPDPVTNAYAPQRLDARRGTPLDAMDTLGRFFGSRMWLWRRAKQDEATRRGVQGAIAEAMAWATVPVSIKVRWLASGLLGYVVKVGSMTLNLTLPGAKLMPWPIPQPQTITDRAAGIMEAAITQVYTLLIGAPPPEPVDCRSPTSISAIYTRVLGETGFDLWLYLARLAQELMPDTAIDWLPRHGNIWGVPQVQPVPASGNLVLPGGIVDTVVPGGFTFSAPGGAAYDVINAGTIAAAGPFSIGVSAVVAGSAGDLLPGVTLTAVTPLNGLISQSGTVDANGITGGEDIESTDDWRAAILQRIRQRGGGGDANDFEGWTQAILPGALVYAFSPGLGQITVAFAMPTPTGWRVPTSTELSEATAYLNDATNRKPLGAPVVSVIAVTLQPVDYELAVNPDTTSIQQAVTNALGAYFMTSDITINGTLYMSRSDAAISEATGVQYFDRSEPSGDVPPGTPTSLVVLGTVAF